ncbi:MAG: SsgA family sporulation/cell division regulator [Frankiaceae bacterium]
MSAHPVSVSTELDLRLVVPGSASLPVKADSRYDVSDPYAVHVAFHTGTGEVVEWTFARQLLTDGVTRPVGEGDVQVWPSYSGSEQVVCLALSSPSGRALFEIPLPQLVEFLTKTYAVIPTGSESDHVDVDAELALLLWSEPEV